MITIFEGPDGAGKTTLVNDLVAKIDMTTSIVNHGPYPGETSIAHHYLESLRVSRNSPTFLDRSWLAEPIYGDVYRNGADRVRIARRRMLDRVALSLQGVVVRCEPPLKNCITAFTERKALNGEYLDNVDQLSAVYYAYKDIRTDLPVIHYDYTTMRTSDLLPRVQAARPFKNEGPGIGSWRPGQVTLLIGDRMNSKRTDWDLPFVSFNQGGHSVWLAEELEAASVPESMLYWINSTGLDGREVNADFVNVLAPVRVVALGSNAAAWCSKNKVAHDVVPHPQFWKRFHADKPYPLLPLLQEVL